MKRVFGKKKAAGPPPPSLSDASAGLGNRAEQIETKISSLDKELRGYREKIKTARSAGAKKTLQSRAMDVLKRKRMYETQRDQLMGQQFNIDQAAFATENMAATVDSVAAMKAANTELKKAMKKNFDVDAVDDLADDMAELMDDMNEMNEALGRNFATPEDIDEGELEAELDLLEEEFEEEAIETPSYLQETSLPTEPSGAPVQKISNEQALAGL